ncbi:hypothetical protein [Massilia sp.]|uniref:hypothetical protein n=1 Tax=Massilia sp. TaxID=1882437 RepID=UPI002898F6ED|nr:hypothetical protein [Massilia sp.]
MSKHIDIMRSDGAGRWRSRTVTIGCCPFCKTDDALCVSYVERDGYASWLWPQAVMCGGCGACGPWGNDDEAAVTKWNQTAGVETAGITEWKLIEPAPHNGTDDFPF